MNTSTITKDQFVRAIEVIESHCAFMRSLEQIARHAVPRSNFSVDLSEPLLDELEAQLKERCRDADNDIGNFLWEPGWADGADASGLWDTWEKERRGPFAPESAS